MRNIFRNIRSTLLIVLAIVLAGASLAEAQDRNLPVTVLASAARSAATVSASDQINNTWSRVHVIINVSAYTSGNYTPKVQGKDPVSGNYYDLCVGTAISATGLTVLKVGPGFGAVANSVCADMLPRTWRVTLAGASTPSMTFSVGAFLGD
jgi:hypothetical protein